MSYSDFILTIIAVLCFWQVRNSYSEAKERRKQHEKILAEMGGANTVIEQAIFESTQQITGRRHYTDFLSEEVGYKHPQWRKHLDEAK